MAITRLNNNSITSITALPSGVVVNTPSFEAFLSNDQSLSHATLTKVQFNSELYDTDGCYDNSTNYRFTPTTAGKYLVYTSLSFKAQDYVMYAARFRIYKNGAEYISKFNTTNNSVLLETTMNYITTIDMNGTSDYIEIYGYIERHGGTDDQRLESGNQECRFGAFRIIQ